MFVVRMTQETPKTKKENRMVWSTLTIDPRETWQWTVREKSCSRMWNLGGSRPEIQRSPHDADLDPISGSCAGLEPPWSRKTPDSERSKRAQRDAHTISKLV